MEYPGVTQHELANARVLNRAFLDCVTAAATPRALSAGLREQLRSLDSRQRTRLSRAPFLLFHLNYSALTGEPRQEGDLLAETRLMPEREWRVVSATLGLLWTLCRDNRHAARFLSGASAGWCERAANACLLNLLDEAAGFDSLLVPRCQDEEPFWQTLLAACRSTRLAELRAVRFSAMQRLLIEGDYSGDERLALAACQRRDERLRIVSKPSR
ncbi:MAG: hypothetical protein AAFX56_03830 [Pseudomonadota bacterium]